MKSRSLKLKLLTPLLLLVLLLVAACSSQEQKLDTGKLIIPGTWACEDLLQQLAAIFSGQTTSWQLEEGNSQPIRVIGRQEGDSSLALIRRHLPPFRELKFAPEVKSAHHDYEMVELLNKYAYGIVVSCRARRCVHPGGSFAPSC